MAKDISNDDSRKHLSRENEIRPDQTQPLPESKLRLGRRSIEEVGSRASVEIAKDERELIEPTPTISEEVFSNIHDSLGEIGDYYKINKKQAKQSFTVSVGAIASGMIALLAGIFLVYKGGTTTISVSTLSAISGLLLNFIGGAYFYLYRESAARLNDFHDKLVIIQATMLAVSLCDQINDLASRDRVKENLINGIMERGAKHPIRHPSKSLETTKGIS